MLLRYLVVLITAMGTVSYAGCNIRPTAGPPGTIYHQRNRAVNYDPFPDQNAGPAIEGGRPLQYERPLPEVTKSQTNPYAANRGY